MQVAAGVMAFTWIIGAFLSGASTLLHARVHQSLHTTDWTTSTADCSC